ncbi:ABC transporter ATP-binding protein [Paenibacillus sp. IHBB 10380]|uniref:ABC transporter ATP-binding protein n=1 Tax=Paenibacillus sp. IHBB 10380 TaxID=1566358 RepID=UPI0005CFDEBE|nr:ABC transporter ATP-binding protein [Paenibacillus sp. IHBB 10380]AJS59492.1 peptide ABC transporter ATP-binding protein [Paenibacillus sp. IHBB 10380]
MDNLLKVNGLQTVFRSDTCDVTAVDKVSFQVQLGETIGIVGESGCGKSVTSLSIMNLLGKEGRIQQGEIWFNGTNLAELSETGLRQLRGKEIAMIFQEPMTSLNPVFTIGSQLIETIRLHMKLNRKESKAYAIQMLTKVGISRPEAILKEYPHTLSGGMRQRVMIAIALACKPKLLIADEPTTALDVTVQAQILSLMKELREESGAAIMLITHDLGIVAEMADKVIVMYAGQIVEEADVFSLFEEPLHPYTKGLLQSIPGTGDDDNDRLFGIPGSVPSIQRMPQGCRFHSRCEHATKQCIHEQPELKTIKPNHQVKCWLY